MLMMMTAMKGRRIHPKTSTLAATLCYCIISHCYMFHFNCLGIRHLVFYFTNNIAFANVFLSLDVFLFILQAMSAFFLFLFTPVHRLLSFCFALALHR